MIPDGGTVELIVGIVAIADDGSEITYETPLTLLVPVFDMLTSQALISQIRQTIPSISNALKASKALLIDGILAGTYVDMEDDNEVFELN